MKTNLSTPRPPIYKTARVCSNHKANPQIKHKFTHILTFPLLIPWIRPWLQLFWCWFFFSENMKHVHIFLFLRGRHEPWRRFIITNLIVISRRREIGSKCSYIAMKFGRRLGSNAACYRPRLIRIFRFQRRKSWHRNARGKHLMSRLLLLDKILHEV